MENAPYIVAGLMIFLFILPFFTVDNTPPESANVTKSKLESHP
jgi:hypothetical protein